MIDKYKLMLSMAQADDWKQRDSNFKEQARELAI